VDYHWLLLHLLPSAGFVLALALLAHVLRERRSPTSTLAWLMAIIFIPYLGVPLYLILGGRKMVSKAGTKPEISQGEAVARFDFVAGSAHPFAPGDGIFPPSSPNRISLLTRGGETFTTVLDLIRDARRTVYVATFILGRDATGEEIVDALAERASKGLEVCLLLDALGCVKISKKFLLPLTEAGGRAAFFMPMVHLPFRGRANLRNHRKMIICDNRAAVIGGMNLASEYMGRQEAVSSPSGRPGARRVFDKGSGSRSRCPALPAADAARQGGAG